MIWNACIGDVIELFPVLACISCRRISLAWMYGGTAPHFLSESVVAFLLNEPLTPSNISDIPDTQKVQKVSLDLSCSIQPLLCT